jgi:cytokinin riboside 5'-monophosphate phosphoribohydrolase
LKQFGYHTKPVVVLDLDGYFDPLWAQIQRGIDEGFIKPEFLDLWYPAPDVDALLRYLEAYEPHRYGSKWTRA